MHRLFCATGLVRKIVDSVETSTWKSRPASREASKSEIKVHVVAISLSRCQLCHRFSRSQEKTILQGIYGNRNKKKCELIRRRKAALIDEQIQILQVKRQGTVVQSK